MSIPTLYGIKNCDTVKKARNWLDAEGVDYAFHDFRADGFTETLLQEWLHKVGIDVLVNKRSTTWKQLSDSEKAQVLAGDGDALIVTHPTLIKRPVLSCGDKLLVGFRAPEYQSFFQ